MGLFGRGKKPDLPPIDPADPAAGLLRAQRAILETGTHIDEHGNRRKLPMEERERMAAELDDAIATIRRNSAG